MATSFTSHLRWVAPLLVCGGVALLLSLQEGGETPIQSAAGPSIGEPLPADPDRFRPPADPVGAFAAWLGQLPGAGEEDLETGRRLAVARRPVLKQLIQTDPKAALAAAVPYSLRRQLPASILALLETPVSGAANYDVEQSCFGPGGRSQRTQWAEVDGVRRQTFTFGHRRNVTTKGRLAVHGIAVDEVMAMTDEPVRVLSSEEVADRGFRGDVAQVGERFYQMADPAVLGQVTRRLQESELELGPDSISAYRELASGALDGFAPLAMQDGGSGDDDLPPIAPSPFTEGAKTMLYIRARFADESPTYEPVTLANAQTRQGQCEDFWFENSYGKSSLTTTFTDVVTLPKNGAEYVGKFGDLRNDANAAAKALNPAWDRDSFNFYTVVTNSPQGGSFGYAGVAQVGSKASHLLRNYISVRTASHEYGHNLGLLHSGYWRTDSPSPIGPDSAPGGYVGDNPDNERIEYGHKFCVMGAQNGSGDFDSGRAHYTAGNKNKIDWLAQGDGDIVSITTSGSHRLYRHDVDEQYFSIGGDGSMTEGVTRAIKINLPSSDPTGFSQPYKYWLNYRLMPTNGIAENWLPHGIQVDWRRDDGPKRTVQLDMTPFSRNSTSTSASTNVDNSDKEDGVLVIGRTYSDVGADIHFTPTAKGGTEPNQWLDVEVRIGTQGSNTPPVITSLIPSATEVNVGQQVTFTVSATDADGDPLAYYWDNDDASIQPNQLNQTTQTKGWGSAGFYVVRCEVSDMKGGKDVRSVVIKVGNPSDTGIVRGRVTQSGRPVEGVFVRGGGEDTWTESDGTYVLAGLPFGTHSINASKLDLTFSRQFTNPVSVGELDAYGIDFTANETWSGGGGTLMAIQPYEMEVLVGASFAFTAEAWDGSGATVAVSPSWSVSGGGSIDSAGVFTATTAGGPFTVTATDGSLTATASVVVTDVLAAALEVVDGYSTEPGGNKGLLRFKRYGDSSAPLVVNYNVAGSATSGVDFVGLGTQVTIPAGQNSVDLLVEPLDDFEVEDPETIDITLQTDAAYLIAPLEASGRVRIIDDGDSAPVVSIAAPGREFVAVPPGVGLRVDGSAVDQDGQPGPLVGRWLAVQSPPGGAVRFFPPSGFTSTAFFSTPGLYELELRVSDGAQEGVASLQVLAGTDGSTFPQTSSEIIRYGFEETSGTNVIDEAGGDHPGAFTGNPTRTMDSGGLIGEALSLDGAGDSVSIENSSDINVGSHGLRTVAFWFKAVNPASATPQVLYEEGGQTRGLSMYLHSNTLWIGGWNNNENGWNQTFLSTPLADTEWHHVAMVLDADATSLVSNGFRGYLDAVEFGSGGAAILNSHTGAIGIGAKRGDTRFHTGNSGGTGDYFTGLIDGFHLYNSGLTQLELGELLAQGRRAPQLLVDSVAGLDRAMVIPTGQRLLLSSPTLESGPWSGFTPSGGGSPVIVSEGGGTTVVDFPGAGPVQLEMVSSADDTTSVLQLQVHAGIDSPVRPTTTQQVIRYRMNENSGGTVADDVGTSNTGTLTNGPTWTTGIEGSAVSFNGADAVIAIANDPAINNSSSFTQKSIALWFRPNVTPAAQKEVLYEQGGGTRGLTLYLDGSTLYAGGWNAGLLDWTTTHMSVPIVRGEWHHVVLTLDVEDDAPAVEDGLRLHLNGVLVGEGRAAEMASHTGNIGLGGAIATTKFHDGNGNGDGFGFSGVIDEFHYFNDRVLTLSEIAGLYAFGNILPSVDAGPDQPDTQSLTVNLAPVVVDDGQPGPLTADWTALEGAQAGSATFDQLDGNGVPQRAIFPGSGYYKLRLQAFDGQGTTIDEMQLSVSDGPRFVGWINGYFDLDASDRQAEANTDGDPFNQFYEYATGGDLMQSDSVSDFSPITQVSGDGPDDYFEVRFRRRVDHAARGLTYSVEFSDTLLPDSWSPVGGTVHGTSPIDAEFEWVTVRFGVEIGPLLSRKFARLVIDEG